MHDSNHTDEFEEYLRDQVSDHRMYPSDRVWKNIRSRIHTPKKWPALSFFSIVIISALVIGTILNKPVPDSVTPNFVYSLQSQANNGAATKSTEAQKNTDQIDNNTYSIEQLTSRTIVAAVEKIKIDEAIATQLGHSKIPSNFVDNITTGYPQNITPAEVYNSQVAEKENTPLIITADNSASTLKNINYYLFDVTSRLKSILNSEPVHYSKGGAAFFSQSKSQSSYDDDFDFRVPPERKDLLPSLDQLGKNSSRFDFRFYVTPSISYRRFNQKNQVQNKNASAALESDYRVNPSMAINQTPALGYETGFGLGYKLNDKFSLTGGFQFNISQYKINAFLYKDEPIALILNEGADHSSTVNTVSNLQSIPGSTPLTIKNRYFQISMPLGIEWRILGSGRLSWGAGAAVQPTYTFDKQPLIMSSNYKNYADGSAYVRNWNVNANVETFLGYKTGNYRWQIGPQIRYQLLPSLVNKYPNREYLFNYGLKFGVVKQIR